MGNTAKLSTKAHRPNVIQKEKHNGQVTNLIKKLL